MKSAARRSPILVRGSAVPRYGGGRSARRWPAPPSDSRLPHRLSSGRPGSVSSAAARHSRPALAYWPRWMRTSASSARVTAARGGRRARGHGAVGGQQGEGVRPQPAATSRTAGRRGEVGGGRLPVLGPACRRRLGHQRQGREAAAHLGVAPGRAPPDLPRRRHVVVDPVDALGHLVAVQRGSSRAWPMSSYSPCPPVAGR